MAVEIPVVIDIDKAFKEAAQRVDVVMKPLQQRLSKKTLNLDITTAIDKKGVTTAVRSLSDILKSSTISAKELRTALGDVRGRLESMDAAGKLNPAKGLTKGARELLAAYSALESKLRGGSVIDRTAASIARIGNEATIAGQKANSAIATTNAGLRAQGGIMRGLVGYFSAYTVALAGIRLIRNVRETTAEFEMQRVALGGIIQDMTRANQLFAEIKAAAVQSPFEIKDLVSFTKQLSAYRIETDKLFDVTMRLADVSAGLGVDMSRLVLAYGQVRAASVLRGQELRQFTEAGIPLVDLLAKKFSALRGELVSTGEVFELISERAVPFAMIEEIFEDMTNAGGIFYQMQLKQSETLKGQWMKLKDVISIAYDEMGRTSLVNEAMTDWIRLISTLVKNWERIASVVNVAVFSYLAYRAAVKGVIPFYNLQQSAIVRQIKLEKQQQIEQIKLASRTDQLTKADQRRIATIRKMNVEDYKRIFAMDKMTQSQAMMVFWRNKDNKAITEAIRQTGILTNTQMNAIKKMSAFQIRMKVWGTSIRTFFTSVGSAIAAFWPIAAISAAVSAITGLISAHKSQVEAIQKVDKAYQEQEMSLMSIENAYRRIQKAINDVEDSQRRATKEAASFGQKLEYAQKVVEMLKKFGLGGDFDLSLLNTENIDDFVNSWLEQLNKANELTREWGRNVAEVANSWEASILGIHFAGDNLSTDIKQLTSAFVKMTSNKSFRQDVSAMSDYLDKLEIEYERFYTLLSESIGEDAKLAIAGKRRNESEYEYQMRLIKNYEKIRQYAQSDQFILSGAMKSFKPMTSELIQFENKLDEVQREFEKTVGSFKGQDEITIKMAIDKIFAENQWDEWLKEAWIERLNGKYNMNIQIRPTVDPVNVPQGMKSIIASEFDGLFTEQELLNMSSVSDIGKAIDEKMKNAAESIKEADRQANNLTNNELWSEGVKEKIWKAQGVINEEMAKSEKDRNKTAIKDAYATIDALTKQNDVYDEQIKKKKDSAIAEYNLAKAAKERLLNENLSDLGSDIKNTFPQLLKGDEIADKLNLDAIGEQMKKTFSSSNADLLARPLVDAAELVKRGWKEAGEGIATVFTSTYDFEDSEGKHNLLVTPILPNGDVLSPSELDSYVDSIIRSGDIFKSDEKKLVIGIDVADDAGEQLHKMQEEYYGIVERMKDTSRRFLISDEDLQKIKDGSDAYDIWAKNMKAIADEREKMANAGVSDLTVAEEQARLDAERAKIEEEIEKTRAQIADWNYAEAKAKYDSLNLAIQQATTASERAKAEDELNKFMLGTSYAERAALAIELQRLEAQWGIANSALLAKNAILDTFGALDKAEKFWKLFGERYNFTLPDQNKSVRQAEDPWIILYKNRLSFMKDFQKGVEKMNKFLEHSYSLEREREIMKGRGLSVGIKTEDLFGTPEELRSWYKSAIDDVVKQIKKLGGKQFSGLGVTEILAKDLNGRKIKKYQDLLQELWKGLTDFDTNQMEKKLEESLKKMEEEVKRSEAAQNFYREILGITGDEQLSTDLAVAVYGDVGSEFKDRIQRQLDEAFMGIDTKGLDEKTQDQIIDAFVNQNFDVIRDNLERFPDDVKKVLKTVLDDVDKYNASLQKKFADAVAKSGDATQKIATIKAKADQDILDIITAADMAVKKTPDRAKEIYDAAERAIKAIEGQRDLDVFKAGEDYVKYFAELNVMTAEQATTVRGKLRDAYIKAFRDGTISADELYHNLRAVETQFRKLTKYSSDLTTYLSDGVDGIIKRFDDFGLNIQVIGQKIAKNIKLDTGEEVYVNNILRRFAKEYGGEALSGINSLQELFDKFPKTTKGIAEAGNAVSEMGVAMSTVATKGSFALAIVDAVFKAVNGAITGVQEFINELNRTRSDENKLAGGMKYITDLNKYIFEGWEKVKSGDIIGATMNLASAVASVFSNIQEDKVERINKKIEEQEELIDSLSRSYSRLQSAEEKVFGADIITNYNQRIAALQAQEEAYRKQAALEREKGKSADEQKAKDYEKSAIDIANEIADLQTQLSEKFSGTDLASASRDFASSWIDAYKSFSSTTDVIKEKFQDMIQNMIVESLAAKVVEKQLKPIFELIDSLSTEGNQLSLSEIQSIANRAKVAGDVMNQDLTNLMNALSAVGLNMRTMGSGLTGIAKDIQGASEESILGLAAGVNTQNFYLSQINANVGVLVNAIANGASPASPVSFSALAMDDPMREHVSSINTNVMLIAERVESLESTLRKVVYPKGTNSTTHYVAIQ